MTRIALSGAHQVGKTTLIESVSDSVGVAGGVMRDLAKAGFGVARDTSPETIAAYARAQLASEVAASDGQPDLLSDRVLLDGLAYVEAAIENGSATYPWTEGELSLMRAAARLHAASFDVHVFLPIEFEAKSDLSFHAGGGAFRRLVSDAIERHLSDDWPPEVVRIAGSPAERETTLRELLSRAQIQYNRQ